MASTLTQVEYDLEIDGIPLRDIFLTRLKTQLDPSRGDLQVIKSSIEKVIAFFERLQNEVNNQDLLDFVMSLFQEETTVDTGISELKKLLDKKDLQSLPYKYDFEVYSEFKQYQKELEEEETVEDTFEVDLTLGRDDQGRPTRKSKPTKKFDNEVDEELFDPDEENQKGNIEDFDIFSVRDMPNTAEEFNTMLREYKSKIDAINIYDVEEYIDIELKPIQKEIKKLKEKLRKAERRLNKDREWLIPKDGDSELLVELKKKIGVLERQTGNIRLNRKKQSVSDLRSNIRLKGLKMNDMRREIENKFSEDKLRVYIASEMQKLNHEFFYARFFLKEFFAMYKYPEEFLEFLDYSEDLSETSKWSIFFRNVIPSTAKNDRRESFLSEIDQYVKLYTFYQTRAQEDDDFDEYSAFLERIYDDTYKYYEFIHTCRVMDQTRAKSVENPTILRVPMDIDLWIDGTNIKFTDPSFGPSMDPDKPVLRKTIVINYIVQDMMGQRLFYRVHDTPIIVNETLRVYLQGEILQQEITDRPQIQPKYMNDYEISGVSYNADVDDWVFLVTDSENNYVSPPKDLFEPNTYYWWRPMDSDGNLLDEDLELWKIQDNGASVRMYTFNGVIYETPDKYETEELREMYNPITDEMNIPKDEEKMFRSMNLPPVDKFLESQRDKAIQAYNQLIKTEEKYRIYEKRGLEMIGDIDEKYDYYYYVPDITQDMQFDEDTKLFRIQFKGDATSKRPAVSMNFYHVLEVDVLASEDVEYSDPNIQISKVSVSERTQGGFEKNKFVYTIVSYPKADGELKVIARDQNNNHVILQISLEQYSQIFEMTKKHSVTLAFFDVEKAKHNPMDTIPVIHKYHITPGAMEANAKKSAQKNNGFVVESMYCAVGRNNVWRINKDTFQNINLRLQDKTDEEVVAPKELPDQYLSASEDEDDDDDDDGDSDIDIEGIQKSNMVEGRRVTERAQIEQVLYQENVITVEEYDKLRNTRKMDNEKDDDDDDDDDEDDTEKDDDVDRGLAPTWMRNIPAKARDFLVTPDIVLNNMQNCLWYAMDNDENSTQTWTVQKYGDVNEKGIIFHTDQNEHFYFDESNTRQDIINVGDFQFIDNEIEVNNVDVFDQVCKAIQCEENELCHVLGKFFYEKQGKFMRLNSLILDSGTHVFGNKRLLWFTLNQFVESPSTRSTFTSSYYSSSTYTGYTSSSKSGESPMKKIDDTTLLADDQQKGYDYFSTLEENKELGLVTLRNKWKALSDEQKQVYIRAAKRSAQEQRGYRESGKTDAEWDKLSKEEKQKFIVQALKTRKSKSRITLKF